MASSQTQSYTVADTITKSDTVDFPRGVCDAIYVGTGTAGTSILVAVLENGLLGTFYAGAGTLLPIRARRVNSTTTTTTNMVALYY